MEQTRLGKVMVIPLRVNVNIKTLLLDELLVSRLRAGWSFWGQRPVHSLPCYLSFQDFGM